MSCVQCASNNEAEFPTELVFHFPGLQCLDKPGIFLYPRILVCLHCGFSWFTTSAAEKALLAKDAVVVKLGSGGKTIYVY